MGKKKPQSYSTHVNDKRALANLQSVFPEHWKIDSLRDVFSGNEYGQDWIVLLTDEENFLSGAEFRIQSKTFTVKIGKSQIGTKIKVATLNYLHDLVLPVLLHYYHYPTDTAYYMWLDEWYLENYDETWEQKDEVMVYISTDSILSTESVEKIRRHVSDYYSSQILLKKSQIVSETDPDFNVEFSSNGRLTVTPKHPDARRFKIIFRDKEAAEKFNEAIETGAKIPVSGLVDFGGILGTFAQEVIGPAGEIVFETVLPDRDVLFQIEFRDIADTNILKAELVRMKLLQSGTKLIIIEGAYRNILNFTFTFDLRNDTTELNLHMQLDANDPTVIWRQINLIRSLQNTKAIVLTNLEEPSRPIVISDDQKISQVLAIDIPDEEIRLIQALAFIKDNLGIPLALPESYSGKMILFAEAIVEGMVTGKASMLLNVPEGATLKITSIIKNPLEILRSITKGGIGQAVFPGPREVELLGQIISLGSTENVFQNMIMINIEEVQSRLKEAENSEDVEVIYKFKIDREQSYTRFLDWPREIENE